MKNIQGGSMDVFVTDLLGRKIYSRQLNDIRYEFKTQIDLSKFTTGIYFLYVITEDKHYLMKLGIQ
ncbi:MAG: T9SS type A sorting domain-containing protein [Cytophagales bacterium]|nr:T9SS type A sorting domain-containing protein [Cytophagales bacterium]